MSDEPTPTLASMLAGDLPAKNAFPSSPGLLETYIRPLGSGQHHEPWQWVKANPNVSRALSDLIGYLSMLPLGRTARGAAIGNKAIMATREAQSPTPDAAARMQSPIGEDSAFWSANQPLPYPRYDYQVFGDKGRWMNDPLPPIRRHEGEAFPGEAAGQRGVRESANALASSGGREPPWHTTDPFVSNQFALSGAGREMFKMPSPELGYGSSPGMPQYPRIPSHWVPENNPARFTLRAPAGIADRATFTGNSLADILNQISRTELKPSARAYLEALARQRFGKPNGDNK